MESETAHSYIGLLNSSTCILYECVRVRFHKGVISTRADTKKQQQRKKWKIRNVAKLNPICFVFQKVAKENVSSFSEPICKMYSNIYIFLEC